MRKLLLLLSFLILFSYSVLAGTSMGVSPAGSWTIHTGQEEVNGEYRLFPGDTNYIRLSVAHGDLVDHLYLENDQKELIVKTNELGLIKYKLNVPEGLQPGEYRTVIVAEEYTPPEEFVEKGFASASAAIGFVVILTIPNEGRFLEATIDVRPQNIKSGDVAFTHIEVINIGTESIEDLSSNVNFLDHTGKILSTSKTNTLALLNPAEKRELRSVWRTEDVSSGDYIAETTLFFGGKNPMKIQTGFRIGDIFIKIMNVSTDLSQAVGKVKVKLQSNWNDVIKDVYAEITIRQDGEILDVIKSSAEEIGPWGEIELTAFWDRKNLLPGEYDMDIKVYYYDKLAQEYLQVKLIPLGGTEDIEPESFTLLTVVVVLLGVILVVNLLWFAISFRKKKKK